MLLINLYTLVHSTNLIFSIYHQKFDFVQKNSSIPQALPADNTLMGLNHNIYSLLDSMHIQRKSLGSTILSLYR